MDFVTGLPKSGGNTAVLTVVDCFSKMAHFIALPKLPSAKETALIMLKEVFRIHGFPKAIVLDQGPQFVSRFWREFCRLIGARASLTSGYHPEANGQTEHLNQQLENGLRCLVSQNQSSWSTHLIWVEFAHNLLPTSATGLSPFKCVSGFQPLLIQNQRFPFCRPTAWYIAAAASGPLPAECFSGKGTKSRRPQTVNAALLLSISLSREYGYLLKISA